MGPNWSSIRPPIKLTVASVTGQGSNVQPKITTKATTRTGNLKGSNKPRENFSGCMIARGGSLS